MLERWAKIAICITKCIA